ncbi:MAG: CopD family protein [Gammaproteobacteria bacterium]|nr:CopD family protein [Gammaproteobacteria bacterium]
MLWIKTAHILFVMSWMAGVFYLPRIIVHYVEGNAAGEDTRRLVIMAEKLFRFSTLMALLAIIPGLWLWLGYNISGDWMLVKLGLVMVLIAYQLQCFRYIRQMQNSQVIRSSSFFRFFNESALIIVIPILILVVIKPF